MKTIQTLAAPAGRVLLASLFLLAGLQKIGAYDGTVAYMSSQGVPGFTLPFVIGLEVLGALAIIVGWQTRLVAFLLAGFSLVSAALFHFKPDDDVPEERVDRGRLPAAGRARRGRIQLGQSKNGLIFRRSTGDSHEHP